MQRGRGYLTVVLHVCKISLHLGTVGVKEASERAILQLRTLQNAYVTAVRKASQTGGEHPTTALFQSQDLLRPFLLAANYPNASPHLLDISLKGMSLLIRNNAICPGDGIHMVRVWTIQANVCASALSTESKKLSVKVPTQSGSWFSFSTTSTTDVSSSSGQGTSQKKESSEKLALELLRCLILLLENKELEITDEQWTASLALCCILGHVQALVVQQAAKTTLHQVLSLLFVSSELHSIETWRDLLILASKEPTPLNGAFSHCKSSAPSPTLCLELLCRIVRGNPKWFLDNLYEIEIESLQVSKALLEDTTIKSFELVWRSYALASAILTVNEDDDDYTGATGTTTGEETSGAEEEEDEDSQIKEADECREQLLVSLVQGIVRATEACRNNHDFEDGYVYTGEMMPAKGKSKPFVTLIPDSLLWRAGLALETLHTILEKNPHSVVHFAEAVSDLATIGASCRDHMLQLVECGKRCVKGQDTIVPTLFRRAEEIQSAALASQKASEGPKNLPSTSCNVGDVLWTAFHCILEMSRYVDEETSFAPSLSVLQHFLKRFPGSREITLSTLIGYDRLAHIIESGNALQRKALLSSLCKLSLPSWGKHDSSVQLQDHNVEALICLLRIVHRYRENILDEWYMVLWTFEELSSLNIAAPRLSDEGYRAAMMVSLAYARIAPLSTILSVESLSAILDALVEISKSSADTRGFATVADPGPLGDDKRDGKGAGKDDGTIGGKLMSFAGTAGKAILGAENGKEHEPSHNAAKIQRVKTNYAGEYRRDFLGRLSASRALRSDQIAGLPIALLIMTDISLSNTFRFKTCGATISAHLCELAGSSKEARAYAMDTLSLLVTSQLSDDKPIPAAFVGPAKLVSEEPSRSEFWEVTSERDVDEPQERMSQVDLLSPLCDTIKSTKQAGVAEAGMTSLRALLEGSGHTLCGKVWAVVIEAVSSLSGEASYEIDRTGSDWSSCCMLGFRCLKLIVDDFLEELPPPEDDSSIAPRKALMECCSSFGSSRHDVNTSLTAIGLLWTIADQDADTSSIERALSKLVLLSSDSRTEVRNCAVNTLFSCIVGKGQAFTVEDWERCICDTVFGVYDQVLSRGGNSQEKPNEDDAKGKYKTNVHHSRDSADKQWATTEVLAHQGLSRVLRNNFSQLLETTGNVKLEVGKSSMKGSQPWFVEAWSRILELALNAATQAGGRDTLDLRSTGVDLIVLCCQLSCNAGIRAAITPARVGTNMEVVNGALRSVGEAKAVKPEDKKQVSESVGLYREEIFESAFDKLTLFQIHLEGGEGDKEDTNRSIYLETVIVQVLQRLVEGLSKLFECCKDDELSPTEHDSARRRSATERYLSHETEVVNSGDFEARFVHLVTIIAKTAVGDQARFLTQAQRGALDLLRQMASHGSNHAVKDLASLAGPAFFWVTENDGGKEKCNDGTEIEMLAREAATVVSDEIKNELITDETTVEVLCMLLSIFASESDKESWKHDSPTPAEPNRKRSYKLFIPVMEAGLSSAERLAKSDNSTTYALLELLWERVDEVLSQMLSPIHLASHAPYMSQACNLSELVKLAVVHAPATRQNEIAALLSSGALKSMHIAKDHAAHVIEPPRDGIVRSKRRLDDSLKLFRECMSSLCRLLPEGEVLQSLAIQVLKDALASFDTEDNTREAHLKDVTVEIARITCQAIKQGQSMEALVISLFPQLCLLIAVDHVSLRTEVASIIETVNISKSIAETTSRMQDAERRAEAAETENEQLKSEVKALQEENEKLQHEIA